MCCIVSIAGQKIDYYYHNRFRCPVSSAATMLSNLCWPMGRVKSSSSIQSSSALALVIVGLMLQASDALPVVSLLHTGSAASAPSMASIISGAGSSSSSSSSSKTLIWPDEIEDNALAEHANGGGFVYKQLINSRNGAKHEQQQQHHQQSSSSIFFWPSTGHHHSRHSRNASHCPVVSTVLIYCSVLALWSSTLYFKLISTVRIR